MDRSLLDTDTFSEILRGQHKIVCLREREYRAEWDRLTLSAVTVMEVVCGRWTTTNPRLLSKFESKIADQKVLSFGRLTSELAGKIAAGLKAVGKPVGFPDAMIAATAIEHGLVLVSGNIAHFERIRLLGFPLRSANWREADS